MMENGVNNELAEIPLNVVELGESGEPIILMHGWGVTLESMFILGNLLSKYYRVHLIDLPGFGKSPKPQEDWDTKQYAERIAAYIRAKNISPANLLGHSFGGRVSIRLASKYPELVKRVILINSAGLKRELSGKRLWRSRYSKFLNKLCKFSDSTFGTKLYETWFIPKFGSADYKNAGPMRTIMVKAVTEDITPDAEKIQAPTLLLWGDKDDETPVEFGQRFKSMIKDSRLVVMPGKDHFPFIDEGSHVCASYILKFMNGAI